MFSSKRPQNYFATKLGLGSLAAALLTFSCAKEGEKASSPALEANASQTKSGEISVFAPAVSEAFLMQPTNNSPSLFSTSRETIINYPTPQSEQPVKLICIPDSLAYVGFIIEDYELKGLVQDDKLYINVPEYDLIRQCQSKIASKNLTLQIAKLGIRYNAKDFELKNTVAISNTIKVTRDFINSLLTTQVSLNIYCDKQQLLDLGGNPVTFIGKPYFQPNKNLSEDMNNILFINVDRNSILNQGYNFLGTSFNGCNQRLHATSEQVLYPKIYFVDDPLPLYDEDKFLIENTSPTLPNHPDQSYLICYFVDERGKLNWHWGFSSFSPIEKLQITGKWVDGAFETRSDKTALEKVCQNFSPNYSERQWTLFNMEVADNFWSWGAPLNFSTEKKLFGELPFEKIVVFGDSVAENGDYKKYSGVISGRILNEPKQPSLDGRSMGGWTLEEYLANILKKPLYNWANSNDKQGISNQPLSAAVQKYTTEANIWGGEKLKDKTLYIIHVGGSFFINTQGSPEEVFNNLSKDLTASINKLIMAGAKHIALPYTYNITPILTSMKQIDPLNYAKYSKQVEDIFDNVIKNTQLDYGSRVQIIGVRFPDLNNGVNHDPNSDGFQNVNLHPNTTTNFLLARYTAEFLQNIFSTSVKQNVKSN